MAVKKTATAKKTVANKSAAKPLAKKIASAKTGASASKSTAADPNMEAVKKISGAIVGGHFDGYLGTLEDALTTRANAQAAAARESAKTAARAETSEKKVSTAPKKTPKPTIVPKAGKTYVVSTSVKSLAGAKVKFMRFKADTDGARSVVEMLTDKPGSPKGKIVSIPTAGLEEAPATDAKRGKRTPAKK